MSQEEAEPVARETARSSSVIQMAMSSVTLTRDRPPAPAKPAKISAEAPADIQPAKSVPVQTEAWRHEKKAPVLPEDKEARYAALRVMNLKKQVPALQELVGASQKLDTLINYKTGWKQSQAFFDLLKKSMEQINQYTRTQGGKDLDDFYWSTSYGMIYGYAIKTAPSYAEAEKILRQGWELLEGVESDQPRAIPRAMLSMGVNLAQDWVRENPLECALLLDELEGMAQEMGDDKVGDIWRLNAPYLQVRFMKYADNVPEEKRLAFIRRHKQRLGRYLMDDSIRMRNRSAILRGWMVFLDKYGSLTDALPVIREWQERYGDQAAEMNYYFVRLWVELYGEGDWDKAAKTVRLATRAAQQGRKLFDEKNYVKLTKLYYDLLWWPGYELKRQRALKLNKAGKEELKLALYNGKTK